MARRNNPQGKMTEAEFKRDYSRRPEYYNNIARQKGWLVGNEPVTTGPGGKIYCLLCCFMASCCDCTKCSCPTESVRRKGGITKPKRKMARGGAMRKKAGNGGRDWPWCMDENACNFGDLHNDCYYETTVTCYQDNDGDGFFENIINHTTCGDADCSDLGPGWFNHPGNGPEIHGCTDATACNYHNGATEDDGTCYYETVHTCYLDENQNGYWEQSQTIYSCDGTCSQLGPNWTSHPGMGQDMGFPLWFCNAGLQGDWGGSSDNLPWCQATQPQGSPSAQQMHLWCTENMGTWCFHSLQECQNSGCGEVPPPPGPQPHPLTKERLPNIVRRKGGKVNRTMKVTRKRR